MASAPDAPAYAAAPGRAAPPRRGAAAGWRAPLLAALAAGIAGLPGVLAVPVLDRDEARFVQASAQMLESRDPIDIRFQEAPRDKKPVGIHWLQAASVALTSSPEARDVRSYRLPSLAGAMLAAAALAWGAAAFVSAPAAALAGAMLGVCALLSTEAFIAKTDAVLCGATTLAMAALARLYAAARGGPAAPRGARTLMWAGVALATIDKGPVGPMVAGLTLLALWAADRDARWIAGLAWARGLGLVALTCGPWAAAITVATDGAFWTGSLGGDLAPKLAGGHEGHGAPPGVHALLAPVLMFPGTLLLPAAAAAGWRGRGDPGVRFALAWLLPSWLVFELLPTKLPHYPLPLYGALALLAALALDGRVRLGRGVAWTGAGLQAAAALVFAALPMGLALRYGGGAAAAALAGALALAAGGAGAAGLLLQRPWAGAGAALALGAAAHAALAGLVLPELRPLWTSREAARAMARAGLDPRNGLTPGPVAVAGYAEPSLVFALGTPTELAAPDEAAQAVAEGRPALVEHRVDAPFRAALAGGRTPAHVVARVTGYDYSDGRSVALALWRRDAAPPPPPSPPPSGALP